MPWDVLVDYIKSRFNEYLETAFILSSHTSSLDLLPAKSDVYKNFKWHHYDYIGGPKGPNENLAREMKNALKKIRPERRPHVGLTAIITQKQYNADIESYIISQLKPIPDFPPGSGYKQPRGEKLNQFALTDFLRMRDAALKDKVPIVVRDSYRPPKVAARNAARSGNRNAVAKFSVHMLGLAIDLNMSYKIGNDSRTFSETSTRPM